MFGVNICCKEQRRERELHLVPFILISPDVGDFVKYCIVVQRINVIIHDSYPEWIHGNGLIH